MSRPAARRLSFCLSLDADADFIPGIPAVLLRHDRADLRSSLGGAEHRIVERKRSDALPAQPPKDACHYLALVEHEQLRLVLCGIEDVADGRMRTPERVVDISHPCLHDLEHFDSAVPIVPVHCPDEHRAIPAVECHKHCPLDCRSDAITPDAQSIHHRQVGVVDRVILRAGNKVGKVHVHP